MVLSKIQQSIKDYKKWLRGLRHHPHAHLWESLRIFQENWQPDAPDAAAMFDGALQNPETRRLWQAENWRPKEVMSHFWKHDSRAVRAMFDDLFNETKAIEARVSRFLFGCDLLLAEFKKSNPSSIVNNHYHADYQLIALYLAFRYPDTYAPYDFAIFQKAMAHFQARDVPQANDLPRYFKVQRTLTTFLEKDSELPAIWQSCLHPRRHFSGKTLLWTADFCRFAAGEAGKPL